MGLTKRKDSYYVEFQVLDDGEVLKLASGGGGPTETLESRFSQQDSREATGGDFQDASC